MISTRAKGGTVIQWSPVFCVKNKHSKNCPLVQVEGQVSSRGLIVREGCKMMCAGSWETPMGEVS